MQRRIESNQALNYKACQFNNALQTLWSKKVSVVKRERVKSMVRATSVNEPTKTINIVVKLLRHFDYDTPAWPKPIKTPPQMSQWVWHVFQHMIHVDCIKFLSCLHKLFWREQIYVISFTRELSRIG